MPRSVSCPLLVVAFMAWPIATLDAQTTVTLDGSTVHQTMNGWECTTFVVEPCTPPTVLEAIRDTVLALAVRDVGIDRVRLEVRSGVENATDYYQEWFDDGCPGPPSPAYQQWRENRYATVDDNGDPDVIDWAGFHFTELDWTIETIVLPMRALLQARGEELFVNLCYVAFTGQIQGGSYGHDVPEEYAELVLATHLHMQQAYGFVPDGWEVILEPDNVSEWNGTLIGEAIAASGAKLEANGIFQRFVAPSNSSMSQILSYFDDMIAVAGVLGRLDTFSYHRYGANTATLVQMVQRAEQHGLRMAMLEWWFGNADHDVLREDLTTGRNSAWQGRTLGSLFEIDASDPENLVVEHRTDTKYNRQYFKHVRRGAHRIEATSDDGAIAPVAFVNDDGRWVVVVDADAADSLAIHGLPAGTYGIFYTTGAPQLPPTAYDVQLPDATITAGEPLATAIPDAGLITIHGRAPAVAVGAPAPADGAVGLSARPNPFRTETSIGYTLPGDAYVVLDVYDVAGRLVRRIAADRRGPGRHTARWRSEKAPPGVYVCRLSMNGRAVAAQKLVLTP